MHLSFTDFVPRKAGLAALENAYLFEKDEKTHEKATKKVQEKLSARVKKENAADADVRRA